MADDRPLRSAYELALERLREKDRLEGSEPRKALSAAQKREIARLRQEAQAKLAELEILHRDKLAEVAADPEKAREAEEHYRTDRRRVESSLETAIARVKKDRSG
jgi:hypothetical protein